MKYNIPLDQILESVQFQEVVQARYKAIQDLMMNLMPGDVNGFQEAARQRIALDSLLQLMRARAANHSDR